MCYHLYGSINEGIDKDNLRRPKGSSQFHFVEGSVSDIKNCIINGDDKYKITNRMCDCKTAVGSHETESKELKDLENYICDLRKIKGIKHIIIAKCWNDEITENQYSIHIDEDDIVHFLANIEENSFYKIQLFNRYR